MPKSKATPKQSAKSSTKTKKPAAKASPKAKSLPQFNCTVHGVVPYVLIDGYDFGDRLLEGVMFRISQSKSGLVAHTDPSAKDYMADLNEKKHLKDAAEFAAETDIVICPKCQDEGRPSPYIEIAENGPTGPGIAVQAVPLSNLGSLFGPGGPFGP